MRKLYSIKLSPTEREELETLSRRRTAAASKVIKARALLLCDQSEEGLGLKDSEVVLKTGIRPATLERLRQRCCEIGPLESLERKKQVNRARKFTSKEEARLITMAKSEPPEGCARWTLRLLAGKLVELEVFDTISHEAVRQQLKKKDFKPWLKQCWCIPPKADASFVACMEDVLEVYQRPRDELYPLVCMDEFCKQLVGEVRDPQPPRPGTPARYDSEYVRHGSASAFVIYAPLEGRREVYVGPDGRRTAQDYARALEFLATGMFPNAKKIILVEDNLNTHCDSSLYAAFPPKKARRLAERFERHHTPRHGSWLDIAESEIAALVRTGLPDRVESLEEFRKLIAAAAQRRNDAKATTTWQFTNEMARVKLKETYPSIQD